MSGKNGSDGFNPEYSQKFDLPGKEGCVCILQYCGLHDVIIPPEDKQNGDVIYRDKDGSLVWVEVEQKRHDYFHKVLTGIYSDLDIPARKALNNPRSKWTLFLSIDHGNRPLYAFKFASNEIIKWKDKTKNNTRMKNEAFKSAERKQLQLLKIDHENKRVTVVKDWWKLDLNELNEELGGVL